MHLKFGNLGNSNKMGGCQLKLSQTKTHSCQNYLK